tara:strand:+ start:380 stop:934 length:555 start_codon:yes stop_codon:yes gene_type:complete
MNYWWLVPMFAITMLSGCGTVKKINPFDNGMTEIEKTNGEIPEWFVIPEDSNPKFISSVATDISKDMQFAIDKAMMTAKIQLAARLKTDVNSLFRSSSLESGYGVKDVETETDRVSEVRVRQSIGFFKREKLEVFKENGGYRAYVKLKIKVDEARRLTDNRDKTSRNEKFKSLEINPTVEVKPI